VRRVVTERKARLIIIRLIIGIISSIGATHGPEPHTRFPHGPRVSITDLSEITVALRVTIYV
jgi:hypothetical protein